MNIIPIQLLFLLGIGIFLLCLWAFSPAARIRRALRKLQPTPLRDVREGLVKITGRIVAIEPLTAPLSGRSCVYFDCHVTACQEERKVTLVREIDRRDFLVDDGTGIARIEVAQMQAAVNLDGHWMSGGLNDAHPKLGEFLARHGHTTSSLAFNRGLAYREGSFEIGERVSVAGHAEQEPDPGGTGTYREAPTRWVLRDGGQGLLVSDDPST